MGIKAVQNEIGRRLKLLRKEKEFSQEYVANEIKLSRDHLSNIENYSSLLRDFFYFLLLK